MFFVNQEGRIRLDPEKLIERAFSKPIDDSSRIDELRAILQDGLNSFEGRMENLPEDDRRAVECLLYKELADCVFELRLSLETRLARQRILKCRTREEKMTVVRELGHTMADIEALHGKS